MSEYQYIEFIAIDAPVSERNLKYMRRQSTRAEISKWRFTNEYHFGDFRGDATEMLRRGYDAHLHFANYGVRKLMFRLPHGLPCEKRTFAKYAIRYLVDWDQDKRGKGGVLTMQPDGDAGTFADNLEDVDEYLERLASMREMLMSGDLRPLFLAWLACCNDEDAPVPPIPAGLDDLTDPLEDLAEFYEIPQELIDAAAKQSPPAPAGVNSDKLIDGWLRKQKKADLQKIVREFLSEEPATVRSRIMAGIRDGRETEGWPVVEVGMTFGELCGAAGV